MTTGRLPLTVIGGYLGAGKTTLVNEILPQAGGRRFAVIVNDFGAINIDAGLIRARDGDTISLTNGCMCCSGADGTATALMRILARADDFDHILIEASGVAEPGKIAQSASAFRLPLDGVLVVVDVEQVRTQAANRYVGDVVRRQLRQADLIVLNKMDLVSPSELEATMAFVRDVAPGRTCILKDHARLPLASLLGSAAFDPAQAPLPAGLWDDGVDHGAQHRSWVVAPEAALDRVALDQLVADLGTSAIRAKGHVLRAEDPKRRYLYQQVGKRWSLMPDGVWGAETPTTRIVAIAIALADGGQVAPPPITQEDHPCS